MQNSMMPRILFPDFPRSHWLLLHPSLELVCFSPIASIQWDGYHLTYEWFEDIVFFWQDSILDNNILFSPFAISSKVLFLWDPLE